MGTKWADDGPPLTREEAAACQHPDLRSEHGIDGPY